MLATAVASSAYAADVTVSAAASLGPAFSAMSRAFEALHPAHRVRLNVAASDALLQQIVRGAPVDVYASADEHAMNRAEAQQLLVPGSRRDFARNELVLAVPADSGVPLRSLADLQLPAVRRIAIGNPEGVPVGRYAKAALDAQTLWPAASTKAVYTISVRQSLDYVARGEVDAAFVYAK